MKTKTIRTTIALLAMMLTTATAWADVEINETNFPDANFRSWLLGQDYGEDGVLTDGEIEGITYIEVGGMGIADLTGIAYFTALDFLDCSSNQLTTLDVSHNTALICLDCDANQLTSLNVSNNPNLEILDCSENNLTSLDVSSCTALHHLSINCNQISGMAMGNLIASMPTRPAGEEGYLYVAKLTSEDEHNVITTTQVAVARAKNWYVQAWMPQWQDYDGVEPVTLADNADNSAAISAADGQTRVVVLSGRTLYLDGDWNTLCLPFDVTLAGSPLEGCTVKELDTDAGSYAHATGLDGTTLYLNFKDATAIEAGKPYLVKGKAGISTIGKTAISGTEGYSESEGYASLVDGNSDTKWCSDTGYREGSELECIFKTASPVCVTGYTLTTGDDTGSNPDRNPQVWRLEAKANEGDADWTTIDHRYVAARPSDALPAANTTESQVYAIDEDKQGTYQYFRFVVLESGGDLMQLAELTLQGTADGTIESPIFTEVTIDADASTEVNFSGGKFVGSYNPVSISGENRSILFLGAENTLYYPDAAMQIGACRAHFELSGTSSQVKRFVLNFDGEEDGATAISSPSPSLNGGEWYDLSGRRLSGKPSQRGVYISNGKKIAIK